MTRSLALGALLSFAAAAQDGGVATSSDIPLSPTADDAGTPLPYPEVNDLEKHRTALEALSETTIGTASRAVRYDWRKSTVGFGVLGSAYLELNNFYTGRVGAFVRTAASGFMLELAAAWVMTSGSDATEKLALTPYRQYARPGRLEIDLNVAYPLAEGVVTNRFSFLPAAELVFALNVGFRYSYYLGSMSGMNAGSVFGAIFSPRLGDQEIANLDGQKLPGMQVDRGRYYLMAGFSLDVYFQPGIFFGPRVMIAPPIFAIGQPGISWWWDLTMMVGYSL